MRMQLAAPWFADTICEQVRAGKHFDAILCSTFIDVAVLRSILAHQGVTLPVAVYFHENQFSYPGQVADPGIYQFTAINFTSALCADSLAFNSQYNLETFLTGIRSLLKKSTDMELRYLEERIREKSIILYPGIDFSEIDAVARKKQQGAPVIVWNHRWEHDKDPELFFQTLFSLQDLDFQLIVLGEQFCHCPEIFQKARKILSNHLLHFGYVDNTRQYASLLKQGDIVVSTARHEFFGISILEGVRAGCRPLVPDKLSYKELFPGKYRYQKNTLGRQISVLLRRKDASLGQQGIKMTTPYTWSALAPSYQSWLASLAER